MLYSVFLLLNPWQLSLGFCLRLCVYSVSGVAERAFSARCDQLWDSGGLEVLPCPVFSFLVISFPLCSFCFSNERNVR